MTVRGLTFTVSLSLLASGCGGATPPPPMKPAASLPAPQAPAMPQVPAEPTSATPKYEVKGRRDPFIPVEARAGGSGPTVAAAKLSGIVRSPRQTLALIETSDGLGYILKQGDTLGDGRLVEIGADNVVFSVTGAPGSNSNRVVLRLATD